MKNISYLVICGLLVYFTLPAKAQKITQVYSGALRYNSLEKVDSVRKEFSEMLGKVYYIQTGGPPHYIPEDKELVVTQESVSFNISKTKKYTFLCSNNQDIKILEYSYLGKVYEIELPNLTVYWKIKELESAKKFADDLVYFQNIQHFVKVNDVIGFDSLAAHYRALKLKPAIPEEARKFIVQANAQTELKNYKRAIEFCEKAIEVDPTNPMVYNNQALLFSMVGQYNEAINSMRKYLKLTPDASDARSAQDKIYEWEALK
jgi:tetratricopeptide (TPR) repeat protein